MTIAIIGPGYVGLPSAVVFAELGHHVFLVGNIPEQIERLKQGEVHLHEPGLTELFHSLVQEGRIVPTLSYADAIPIADVVLIAVGTPSGQHGQANLDYVFAAVRELALHLSGYTVVATKSTVPVGTADRINQVIREELLKVNSQESDVLVDIASCPEFLREGTALVDAKNPDRIVIGVTENRARDVLLALHDGLPGERIVTDPKSAELIKYASNAFLATKISFINEIANICEGCGADVEEVARGMGVDSRIGPKFLRAGLGWSGSCFPKDVRALHHIAFSNNYEPQLIKAAIEVNNQQRMRVIWKLEKILGGLQGKTVTIFGLAFKPHTDDARESAAIDVAILLHHKGATVCMHDPVARPDDRTIFNDIGFSDDPYTAAQGADAIVIATEWPEFLELNWKKMKDGVRRACIVDGRNFLDPKILRAMGWMYVSIGRSPQAEEYDR